MYSYQYPHPALTADCVLFALHNNALQVLLIQRKNNPCKGMWAFPGGFMDIDEDIESCAKRELFEETGLEVSSLRQFHVYSHPRRDPRERVVSVAHYALVNLQPVVGGDDAEHARWFPVDALPPLAFDHADMFRQALLTLRQSLYYHPAGLHVLPKQFTPQQLAHLYAAIEGKPIDADDLQLQLLKLHIVERVGQNLLQYC